MRALKRMAKSSGTFDASRYFRGATDIGFHNVGTGPMRALARSIHEAHRDRWSVDDAIAMADVLITDRFIEAKGVGIEVVACCRRSFTPRLLGVWKRWLADGHSANWATTDAICGYLIGPLLLAHPSLAPRMRSWSRHPSPWVRRASAVSLIPSARIGRSLDVAYDVARTLHGDANDLIQKAVGWLLREAGKADPARLERHLRRHGPAISRTTVRYAIERMPSRLRAELLHSTRMRK
jgi:3-methyladenine DNA glycosylase AlkD